MEAWSWGSRGLGGFNFELPVPESPGAGSRAVLPHKSFSSTHISACTTNIGPGRHLLKRFARLFLRLVKAFCNSSWPNDAKCSLDPQRPDHEQNPTSPGNPWDPGTLHPPASPAPPAPPAPPCLLGRWSSAQAGFRCIAHCCGLWSLPRKTINIRDD